MSFKDALIFNAFIQPLIIEKSSSVSKKQQVAEESNISDSNDESDSEVSKIKATSLFCT